MDTISPEKRSKVMSAIHSRTSGLSETAKSELLAEAQRRGYDAGELIWVRQGKDETTGFGVK